MTRLETPESMGDVRNIRRFVAFLGVFFILISQFLIFSQPVDEINVLPPYTWLAVFGMTILILSYLVRPTPFLQKISKFFIFQEQAFWVLAAFLLSVLATVATANFALFTRLNYIPVVTVWLLSAGVYFYAFFNIPISLDNMLNWIKRNRSEIILIALVTLFAATLRLYRLGEIPRILDGDEGRIGLFAQETIVAPLSNPFALWENFGSLYLQLINISLRFFGINTFALRLLPAIGGVLAIPSLYLLARWIGGRKIASIAIIILAFSHSHIHFSRIVSVAYIHGTWLAPLELYLFISGLEKRQSWRAALGGILLAIHFSVYLTAQVILALVLIYMLITFLFYRPWLKIRISQALVFFGGYLVTILPFAFYIYNNPDEFSNRLMNDGTFQSGWIEQTVQLTGQSSIEVLFGRFAHAFLSLIYYPAMDFYGSSSPMLSMISSSLFLVGLAIALWRIRNPAYLLLNGYFWGTTFAVGVFALPPSADSYRMLMALPAALIMTALGLDQILEALGLGYKNAQTAYKISVSAILASLLFFNLWTYYGDFAGLCRYGNTLDRFASYLGDYVKTISSESPVYLLSDGEYFYGSHSSTDFLSETRKITNFAGSVDSLDAVSGETIIASPPRILELEIWAHAHPGGQLKYQYDCDKTILLAYQIP